MLPSVKADVRNIATSHIHILLNSSGPLNGRQEEVIEYIASQPSFDAEVGCPVYYAIHFRNLPGLKSLLAHSSQTSLKECVRSLPSN